MTLIVEVEDVARRLGLPQPLEESDRWLIEQAIADAQSDLEAYLGRSVSIATYTETGAYPTVYGDPLGRFPVHSIVSETAEETLDGYPTGRYTIVYVAGLDGANDPELAPLRRFVRTHAMYSVEVQGLFRRLLPDVARRVTNLSVEGQSVTYADAYAADAQASALGLPGGLPSLKSCDQWRIAGRRVHQASSRVDWPWPYDNWRGSQWQEW